MKILKYCAAIIALLFIFGCSGKKKDEAYYPESSIQEAASGSESAYMNSDSLDLTPEIFVQMGHTSSGYTSNTAAVFMPDGKYILSGNDDATVKLWETESGKEVKTFRCRDDAASVAVSSDGRIAASGDRFYGENINIWDVSTGKKIRSFSLEAMNYPQLSFCNSDRNIIAGGRNETIKMWDIFSGEMIREFEPDPADSNSRPEVTALVLTPDGKKAVAGYGNSGGEAEYNSVRVWDINSGENIISFNKGLKWVTSLAVTPDGRSVLTGEYNSDSVRVYDISTGNLTRGYKTGGTSAIDISAGGRYALFGGCESFELIGLADGKVIRKIEKDVHGWVQSVQFSPDGKYALVGDQVTQPKMWDLETGELVKSFGGYSGQTMTAQISGSGNVLMTGHGFSNSVSLWDYKNGTLLKIIKNDPECLSSTATISYDGTRAGFGGWDMNKGKSVISFSSVNASGRMIRIHSDSSGTHSKAPVFFKDGKKIVWATPARIILGDASDGKIEKQIKLPTFYEIDRISLSYGEEYLLAYTKVDSAFVVNVQTGEVVTSFNGKCAFSYDGRKVFCLNEIFQENRITVTESEISTGTVLKVYNPGYEGSEHIGSDVTVFSYIKFVCSSPEPDILYFSDDQNIFKLDLNRNNITAVFKGHTDKITGIGTTPDGSFLFSSSNDGTTRFWNAATGKETAQFIAFSDGEWIVMTPEGYFNSSPNGAKYINVRIGNKVYSIDNFYEKYYDPAYVASVLMGSRIQPAADIRKGIALPPEVKIISPENNSQSKTETVEISISAKDMGGGIDEIRLYHNGKAVGEDTRGIKIAPKSSGNVKSYTVILVDGINTFKAVGYSRDRTESNPSEIVVNLLAPEKDISLYVLSVGINKYKNPALDLNYAEPDAKAVAGFFRDNGRGLFKRADVNDIYNDQATKTGILSGLKELENTNPQDAVLIYLAGHGENINEKWYFIPHELTYPEREEDVIAKAVSSDELSRSIKNIRAQKVLVLIDACKSGAALIAFRGFEDRKALSQLSRAAGVHVAAASSKDQFAAEVKDLGHGVFTYTLLEGLNGKAASKDENVTVRKLMGYIEEQLPEITKKYRQEAQYPVVDSKGMDFPLVKSRK